MIQNIIDKYIALGHNFRNAQNLAAEEIIISKIASSQLAKYVTLKGGIVMYNLTKSARRVTQDIDFDLIKYSIDETSIRLFIEKLNAVNDDIKVSVKGNIERLRQEDYQGVRVHLELKDSDNEKLYIKLDIGVHTYFNIKQEQTVFSFSSGKETVSMIVNPCEQIAAEKLLSLARLGVLSTRYKDIYDLYYLISNKLLTTEKVKAILNLFLENSKRKPHSIFDLVDSIKTTLNNRQFFDEAIKLTHKWIDDDYGKVKETLFAFLDNLLSLYK